MARYEEYKILAATVVGHVANKRGLDLMFVRAWLNKPSLITDMMAEYHKEYGNDFILHPLDYINVEELY